MGFYGFSLDSRGTLSDLWAPSLPLAIDSRLACWESSIPGGRSAVPGWAVEGLPVWQTDATQPCNTLYDVLLALTPSPVVAPNRAAAVALRELVGRAAATLEDAAVEE